MLIQINLENPDFCTGCPFHTEHEECFFTYREKKENKYKRVFNKNKRFQVEPDYVLEPLRPKLCKIRHNE